MSAPNLIFGNTLAPNSVEIFLNDLFSTTIANYSRTLTDTITATNALLMQILRSKNYKSEEGGTFITENLMYGLTPADTYSGYDTLSTMPTDGITQVMFDWAQIAAPISYDMTSIRKNMGSQSKLVDLVQAKITQGEEGLKESFAQQMMFGNKNNGGLISDLYIGTSGSAGLNPLPRLVAYNSTAWSVGGLDPSISTNAWWKNKSFTSTATTYRGLLNEMQHAYNTCALGSGGPPDIILCDQVTYELFCSAYFNVFSKAPDNAKNEWPFEAKRFMSADIIMDDKVPDVANGLIPTLTGGQGDSTTLTNGTMYFLNSKYFRLRYMTGMDFTMLKDENGKTFKKPIAGDSRVGHMAWMGNLTVNRRNKHGVLGAIARSYSS